jgi:hypothetical protein
MSFFNLNGHFFLFFIFSWTLKKIPYFSASGLFNALGFFYIRVVISHTFWFVNYFTT